MQFPKKRQSDQLKKRDDSPIHITEEGFRQMQEQLARLQRALPERITETRRTAAYGDRSDNAEYKQAKGALRRTHAQILSLQDQLKRVVIITAGPDSSGKVRLGSVVVLETGGAQKTFEILGSHEANPALGRISYQSPLGAALMGRGAGDMVTIRTGSGSKEYTILEVR